MEQKRVLETLGVSLEDRLYVAIGKDKVPLHKWGTTQQRKTFKAASNTTGSKQIGVKLPKEFIMLDLDLQHDLDPSKHVEFDDDKIKHLFKEALIVRTGAGYHMYYMNNNIDLTNNGVRSYSGLIFDYRTTTKKGTGLLSILPDGVKRKIIHIPKKVGVVPKEYLPILSVPKGKPLSNSENYPNLFNLDDGQNRYSSIMKHMYALGKIAGMNDKEEMKNLIKFINDEILKSPRDWEKIEIEFFNEESFDNTQRDEEDEEEIPFSVKVFEALKPYYVYCGQHYFMEKHYLDDDFRSIVYKTFTSMGGTTVPTPSIISMIMQALKDACNVPLEAIDKNLVRYKNGIINIKKFEEGSEVFDINQIPRIYDSELESPKVDKWMHYVCDGNLDKEQLLYEIIGSMMIKIVPFRKAFFLLGPTATGKSTFTHIVRKVAGANNISDIPINELGNNFAPSALLNKTGNIDADISYELIEHESLIKKLTGGDKLSVDRKHSSRLDFYNYATLLLCGNRLPYMRGKDDALQDRFIFLEFNKPIRQCPIRIDPDKDDLEEEDYDYIFTRSLAAINEVFERGSFTHIEESERLSFEFMYKNNSIHKWIQDYKMNDESMSKPLIVLYSGTDKVERLRSYVAHAGEYKKSFADFCRDLKLILEHYGIKYQYISKTKSLKILSKGLLISEDIIEQNVFEEESK